VSGIDGAAGRAPQFDAPETVDAIEECYRRGWTGGFPVVPPAADKVADMLASVGLAPERVVGEVPVQRLTTEPRVANAVMAGCVPEHFPVVLAAMGVFCEHDPTAAWPRMHRQPQLRETGGIGPRHPGLRMHGVPVRDRVCFGEDEEPSLWPPLHVTRGFEPEAAERGER